MNLHDLVRGSITAVAGDLPASLYVMSGDQRRGERGEMLPIFNAPLKVRAQWQSLKADEIILSDGVSSASTVRKVYLYATSDAAGRPWAMWRPNGRSGDLLKDDQGNYWLIDAVLEDFSHEGWVCVQAVLQTVAPRFLVKEDVDGTC